MAETDATQPGDAPSEAVVDMGAAAPHGVPCQSCGCPIEPLDRFCPACGTPSPEQLTPAGSTTAQRHFRCDNCGSRVTTDPGQRSYVCAFCDSAYVVELPAELTGRQPPEFVIGFAITPDQAKQIFQQWLGRNHWFRPSDLQRAVVADKLKGVYLPFWSFSMLARSRWSASIGEYWYRTETYTTTDAKGRRVTRTRRVRETEWWPLSGRHHRFYSGYLVSASRGLPQGVAERIKPFHLPALKRYQPYFLAGWISEEYSVERDAALEACRSEFARREHQNVGHFLPGDTHRDLQLETQFEHIHSDLCILPVYILTYRYRGQVYRFLVNGQTGRCDGKKPLSWARVWLAVGLVLLLLALLIGGVLASV